MEDREKKETEMNYQGTLTVKEIANWIDRSEVFVRRSIENGSLPIGAYTREGSKGAYYISPKRAWEYLGYKRDEENTDNHSTPLHDECNGSESSHKGMGNSLLLDRQDSIGNIHHSEQDSSRET